MIDAIYNRRSIRRFLSKPIADDVLHAILEAGTWAPSEKNQQPWKFVVIRGAERRNMVRCLKEGIARTRRGDGFFSAWPQFIPSAVYTARVLEQAPAIIFALNTEGYDPSAQITPAHRLKEFSDIESISAAMQNMALAATDLGVGSLWTCNIFFAYHELKEWLGIPGEPVAALAIGYTDKPVRPLPRKPMEEVVFFKGSPDAGDSL